MAASRVAGDRGRVIAICLFLAAAVWLVFGQTLRHEFVNYDDNLYVYENPAVTSGLTWPGTIWAFTRTHASNWHPLTWLTHMLDCQLYGVKPAGHHFTNVLLHAATAISLFLVLRRMTGALWPSAFVAALFALHPLRVESVAWVSERKDVLSGFFFVLTIAAYVRFARSPFSVARYLTVVGVFGLGLMCKPMLVTLPFVLLLLDYWPLKRFSSARFARLLLEKIPLLALGIAAGVITMLAQDKAMISLQGLPVHIRLGNAAVSYAAYLGQMIRPVNLVVLYPLPVDGLPAWQVAAAVGLLLFLSAVAWRQRSRHPYLLAGWFWYLGMLVPVIGLVQVGAQARADRYTYLPQIGLYLAIVWWIAEWCVANSRRRTVWAAAGTVALAVLGTCAWNQTRYWRNSEVLWRHALAHTSHNYVADLNLGMALFDLGRVDEALEHCKRADYTDPAAVMAYNNYGNALQLKGRRDDARMFFERALQIDPNFPATHNHLAVVLAESGRTADAIAHFEKAIALKPDYADAEGNLARLLAVTGRTSEAIAHYRKAIALDPRHFLSHYELGGELLKSGQASEALQSLQRAMELKPNDAEACSALGDALAQLGRRDEAVTRYEKALALNPRLPEAHAKLGVLLWQSGRPTEALTHLQRAIELRPHDASTLVNLGFLLAQQHRTADAIARFEQALQDEKALTATELIGVYNALAWVFATSPDPSLRNGNGAIELAERANQLSRGNNPAVLDTLAAAYAEAEEFDRAVQVAQSGIDRARAAGRDTLARQIEQHLNLYQNRRPFRDEPAP
jgi:tetratricopeptide (TPR) repeat protein